jgi:hypothetical protein
LPSFVFLAEGVFISAVFPQQLLTLLNSVFIDIGIVTTSASLVRTSIDVVRFIISNIFNVLP